MIGGAKGIGIGIDFGIPNQYCRATSKPYIEKDVLDSLRVVASAYGKSNDDADRSIVKNLVDASNPFIISNAAFKLNSGFGKYEVDFTAYNNHNVSIFSNKLVSIAGKEIISLLPYIKLSEDVPSYKVKITGLNGEISYWYRNQDGTESRIIITEDGIYQLPVSYNVEEGAGTSTGFNGYSESSCTIEQIPSFEGAFVTDGIDDLITSTKTVQEMLGGSNEITVVSMAHFIKGESNAPEICRINQIRRDTRSIRNSISKIGKSGIFGYTYKNGVTTINNILGDKNDCIAEGNLDGIVAPFSVEGYYYNNNSNPLELCSIAWYWTIIANKVLTTDQINQVIAYFNLDRTLNPDILCNTIKQGITNENHASFGDRLIDFSGNGRDIQLNNIAWKGNSGIGNYPVDFTSLTKTGRVDTITHNSISYSTGDRSYYIVYKGLSDKIDTPAFKIKIKGISLNVVYFYINSKGIRTSVVFNKDGVYELPTSYNSLYTGTEIYVSGLASDGGSGVITIIPSNAGALCLDGINDFGKVTGMPIYKDYTFIIDRQIITNDNSGGIVASKSESAGDVMQGAFIFEYLRSNTISTWSYYKNNSLVANSDSNRNISYQSKYSYNGKAIEIGEGTDSDKLWIGTIRDNDERFANIAIYSLMSFPYSMSKFLIERQLKKHKLGTLYPDMVEFRPIVKQDDRLKSIAYYINQVGANIGQYYPIGSGLGIAVETVQPYTVKSLKVNGVNTIPNADYKGFNATLDSKSPQKITMDIQVDSSLVQWNPVVKSNVEYASISYLLRIPGQGTVTPVIGQYYPILSTDTSLVVYVATNGVDEVANLTINGQEPTSSSIHVNGRFKFEFPFNESPQKINITIDEYIRFEDIVQPYPLFFEFTDENGNLISWGGKAKVGNTITRTKSVSNANILAGLYNTSNYKLNGKPLEGNSYVVEKQMVFKTTTTYLLDNNEPNCILSPRLLRIPNSSYKILGHIPDISGHGNNGVINNSAYAKGSGVNEDGSYQFDGVDDFVTIPTVAGKQVLMKLNWQNKALENLIYDQRDNGSTTSFAIMPVNINDSTNNKIAYQARNANGITYIDGIRNEYIESYSLENIIHNITITNPDVSNKTVALGASNRATADYFAKYALYDFMLFDEISTDNKIKELNEYVGIEAKVELPPYYWDAYGKTNLDADKATIQQRGVAIGDYDLTNYNHTYDKMSGFGGYEFAKFDNTTEWVKDSITDTIDIVSRNGYAITLKKSGTGTNYWHFRNTTIKTLNKDISIILISTCELQLVWELKYKKEGDTSDRTFGIVISTINANTKTEITLPYVTPEKLSELEAVSSFYNIYFIPINISVGREYTIEMLSLHPNALLYDGITDYSKNANIPALTDFTVIAKRVWMNKDNPMNECFIHKGVVSTPISESALMLEYEIGNDTYYRSSSYGGYINIERSNRPEIITYQTTESYNGISIIKGSGIDTQGLVVGAVTNNYWKGVFYKLILYPKTIPLLQINFLKNLMERDEIIDLNNPIFIQE